MPVSAPILCFQHVDAAATLVTPAGTAHTPLCPELPHSTRVDVRKHVNASVCAVAARIPLALLTLTPQQPPVTLQQPAGGDVSLLQPVQSTAATTPTPMNLDQAVAA